LLFIVRQFSTTTPLIPQKACGKLELVGFAAPWQRLKLNRGSSPLHRVLGSLAFHALVLILSFVSGKKPTNQTTPPQSRQKSGSF